MDQVALTTNLGNSGVPLHIVSSANSVPVKIKVSSGTDLKNPHRFQVHQCAVSVIVDGKKCEVTKMAPISGAEWNEEFTVSFTNTTELQFQVHCYDKGQEDRLIGESEKFTLETVITAYNNKQKEGRASLVHGDISAGALVYGLSLDHSMEPIAPVLPEHVLRFLERSTEQIGDVPQWAGIFASLEQIIKITQGVAELHDSAKAVVVCTTALLKLFIDQVNREERLNNLLQVMACTYNYVKNITFGTITIDPFKDTIRRLLITTIDCTNFIQAYYSEDVFATRALTAVVSSVDNIVAKYEQQFSLLRLDFLMGSTLHVAFIAQSILQKVSSIEQHINLQSLSIIHDASWEHTQYPRHREKLLEELSNWAQSMNDQKVYLLTGDAFSGKTTVLNELCYRFHKQEFFAGCVFFSQGKNTTSCKNLLITLVRFFASMDEMFAKPIGNVIKRQPDIITANAFRQMNELIITPLAEACQGLIGSILIVIDGLDTCNDAFEHFIDPLCHYIGDIPNNIRILISMRPRSDMMDKLSANLSNFTSHQLSWDPINSHENALVKLVSELDVASELKSLEYWSEPVLYSLNFYKCRGLLPFLHNFLTRNCHVPFDKLKLFLQWYMVSCRNQEYLHSALVADPSKGFALSHSNKLFYKMLCWAQKKDDKKLWFLTGNKSCGKTTCIKEFYRYCNQKDQVVVAGPTFSQQSYTTYSGGFLELLMGALAIIDSYKAEETSKAILKQLQVSSSQKEKNNYFLSCIWAACSSLGYTILIIIDDLDKCPDATSQVLKPLVQYYSELPSNMRILISTQPHNDIVGIITKDFPHAQHYRFAANSNQVSTFIP